MNTSEINVIFLGAGPTALAGIREVGEYGLSVFAIGVNKYETGLYSKYVTSLGEADPMKDAEKVHALLSRFANEHSGVHILIPTGDEYVEFLSKNQSALEQHFQYSLLKRDVSGELLSKSLFYELCQKHAIPAPDTWSSTSDISLSQWADKVMYPCFIKPVYYHKWAKIYGLTKGFSVEDKDSLLQKFAETSQNVKELIVQELIEGSDDNLVVFTAHFDNDSNPIQIFTGRKIRQYPVGFGTTTCARSENIDVIKDYSIKLLHAIGYRGVCDVEYKYDHRDDTYKIIEINPRIGRWYRMVTKSGKTPLLASVLELADSQQETLLEDIPQKNDKYWYFPIRDIPSILFNREINKGTALSRYLKWDKIWCIYDTKDIKPFFAYFAEMTSKILNYKAK